MLTQLRGAMVWTILALDLILWCVPLLIFSLFKIALPFPPFKNFFFKTVLWIRWTWCRSNILIAKIFKLSTFEIEDRAELSKEDWYLITSNHCSWLDGVLMEYVMTTRVSPMRYLIKDHFKYYPVLNLASIAMECPFMRRYPKHKVEKNPALREKDKMSAVKVCARCREFPSSIVAFAEGTRATPQKRAQTHSPYRYLLRPRTGATAYVIKGMKGKIKELVNVTFIYPDGFNTYWEFCSGKLPKIKAVVEKISIPEHFFDKDYDSDEQYRQELKAWLEEIWKRKDDLIHAQITKNS